MTKKCMNCCKERALANFHKNKRYEDGLNKICKTCKKEYDADNYLERKEKKTNQVEIWQMLNKEKTSISSKKWRIKRRLLNLK